MRLSFVIGVLFLTSCQNNSKLNKQEGLPEVQEFKLPDILHQLQETDTSFHPDRFHNVEAQVSDTVQEQALTGDALAFRKLFIYNGDSSKAIDLFSYGNILTHHNDRDIVEGGEPDTEAGLIDFRRQTRKRILFTGPTIFLLDAKWINDSVVVLAGANSISEEQFQPFLMRMDLVQNQAFMMMYPDTIYMNMQQLLQRRYPQVIFK